MWWCCHPLSMMTNTLSDETSSGCLSPALWCRNSYSDPAECSAHPNINTCQQHCPKCTVYNTMIYQWEFKDLTITFSTRSHTEQYIRDTIWCLMSHSDSDSGRRPLRSAERSLCLVPRCNSTFGDRSFAVAGPRLWNSLPTAIRNISLTIHTFGKHLKTHFFSSWARPRRICDIYDFFAPYTNVLTYLLEDQKCWLLGKSRIDNTF